MLDVYRRYAPDPSLKWWSPPPADRVGLLFLQQEMYKPLRYDDATIATSYAMRAIDFVALETELALTSAWNEPHFCLHEGPWTRGSCHTCDVREAKSIVALIAWLTGDEDMLKKLHSPWVQCMHPGASRYEPCRRCRIDFWYAHPEKRPHDAVL